MSTDTIDQFFYHSFPRLIGRELTEQQEKEEGLEILSRIIKDGLMLTPEKMPLPEYEGVSSPLQIRCCFTLLPRRDLTDHTKFFGGFSIEWNVDALLDLSLMPILYLPTFASERDSDLETVGSKFLYRMIDFSEFMRKARDQFQKEYDENSRHRLKSQCQLNSLKNDINFYNTMLTWFEGLQQTVYPIGYNHYRKIGRVGYYKQKEWRLVGNLDFNGQSFTTTATEQQINSLLEYKDTFATEIMYRRKIYKYANLCQFIKTFQGKHILEYANKIIVPTEDCIELAREILDRSGFSLDVEVL